jgi:hypothetical protein
MDFQGIRKGANTGILIKSMTALNAIAAPAKTREANRLNQGID